MREGYSITFSVCVYVSVTNLKMASFLQMVKGFKCDALLKNGPILEKKASLTLPI